MKHIQVFFVLSRNKVLLYISLFYDWNKTNLGGKKDNLENTSNNMQNLHLSHITNITIWKRQLLHLQSEASSDLL